MVWFKRIDRILAIQTLPQNLDDAPSDRVAREYAFTNHRLIVKSISAALGSP